MGLLFASYLGRGSGQAVEVTAEAVDLALRTASLAEKDQRECQSFQETALAENAPGLYNPSIVRFF